jgi:hypothetical protein
MRVLLASLILCASLHAEEEELRPFVMSDIHFQLGNQMFEIAAALSLAWDHDADAYFPGLREVGWWNVGINREKVFFRLNAEVPDALVEFVHNEPHFYYVPIPFRKNMRIHGYFQSEKYFKHNREKILEAFAPSVEVLDLLQSKYADILAHPCTVGLHVRTFYHDYLGNPWQFSHQPFVGFEYLERAMSFFPEDSLFVVCSDHIEWCKRKLAQIPKNFVFIEGNPHYFDLYLMSFCTHNIISNSTYSWWSAWLNQNPDKLVIAPETWVGPGTGLDTRDVIPEDWIMLSSQSSSQAPDF